ncbi:Protein of unknown function [Amycolatopsis marina]|uniref:DUF2795 domain-containing protein n=1 Tax=Amycolatopsis marina TaxID=490629 RepID=A0A1I0Z6F0_9PSEU|nr:DUF2795 domain-containing protein [Amycolatopsis marina]SFB19843.1 Protein of unknown function [Amycolatopsis marina]
MHQTTDADRLRDALTDADFPASKDDLVRYAERAQADADTVRAIRSIPPVEYSSLSEVVRSVPLEEDRTEADRAAQRQSHTKPGVAEQEKDTPTNPIVEELGENRGS